MVVEVEIHGESHVLAIGIIAMVFLLSTTEATMTKATTSIPSTLGVTIMATITSLSFLTLFVIESMVAETLLLLLSML